MYYAAYAPANLLQKANSGSNWRLSSERVGGTECSFVYCTASSHPLYKLNPERARC